MIKVKNEVLQKEVELAKTLFPNEQLFFGYMPCDNSPIDRCIYRATTLTQRLAYEVNNFPCAICNLKQKDKGYWSA